MQWGWGGIPVFAPKEHYAHGPHSTAQAKSQVHWCPSSAAACSSAAVMHCYCMLPGTCTCKHVWEFSMVGWKVWIWICLVRKVYKSFFANFALGSAPPSHITRFTLVYFLVYVYLLAYNTFWCNPHKLNVRIGHMERSCRFELPNPHHYRHIPDRIISFMIYIWFRFSDLHSLSAPIPAWKIQ